MAARLRAASQLDLLVNNAGFGQVDSVEHMDMEVCRRMFDTNLFGAIGAAIWVFVFFALLDTGSFPLIVLGVVVALFFHAAMYGPQAAFIAEMFPTKIRYTGASMGYQLAGIFGGALAPIISVALLGRFDTSLVVSLYVVAVLALTTACVLLAPETSQIDLHAEPADEQALVR